MSLPAAAGSGAPDPVRVSHELGDASMGLDRAAIADYFGDASQI
jgi:hypothetical protein